MDMTKHLHRPNSSGSKATFRVSSEEAFSPLPKDIVNTIHDLFDDFFDDLCSNFFQDGIKKCSKCRQKNVLSYPVTFCQKCSTQYRDVPQPTITVYRKQSAHASNYRTLTNMVNNG